MELIENRTFDELAVGDSASLMHTIGVRDTALLGGLVAEADPAHVDDALLQSEGFQHAAQEMLGAALFSIVLATRLPGPGTTCLEKVLQYRRPMLPGETVTVSVRVLRKFPDSGEVELECRVSDPQGEERIEGRCRVRPPQQKVSRERTETKEVEPRSRGGRRYERLIEMSRGLEPLRTAVVYPVDAPSLLGAVEAARSRLIVPILIGPPEEIRAAAARAKIELGSSEIVPAVDAEAAAAQAVAMVRVGQVEALMKGSLHTDVLMRAVVDSERGLRTDRRISHVFAIDAPRYPKAIFVTDAAINVYPTLADKRDIIQNAIELAHALGIVEPRVAILSAVETVTEQIRSTLDAAALCKMADRHQITGGILDGPLAFDNAVSVEAARTKGIVSPVAGHADIFVVPDLEAGNMLAKQLEYLADAQIAGIVLGARVPIMLTSRADKTLARLGSCAIALLLARRKQGVKA